ncbi:Crp/Fnr family transcriptional regulator [Acetivibrio sp. MSJd-27]|uniref:Crp/Fnr family transcriptional regulator n=1 Tax=Acetivibrio sp. MSJd-27 TaxID=2841523 RepID=UPI001C0FF16A|nr:Crp/Fnr family transcriptional regulator [Acetivibrio sp. MSJd-27]MBU5449935.1 Crp/Fnr family transcriptional regulator [Acetivibrio sp. MSJd-27]
MEEILKKALKFWNGLTIEQKEFLAVHAVMHRYEKGTRVSYGTGECSGLNIVQEGRIRVFLSDSSGSEITLYRVIPGEVCIFSASCMLKSLDFEIHMAFEEETEVCIIPMAVYQQICDSVIKAKDFTLELVSNRFTDVMRLLGEVCFSDMSKRLAELLCEYSELTKTKRLLLTHERLACDLGTAREVVSRLLKQMEREGVLRLSRGMIEIRDEEALKKKGKEF